MARRIVSDLDSKCESVTFGRLTRVGPWFSIGQHAYSAVCECQCGAFTVAKRTHLNAGCTASCGCLNRELSAARGRAALRRHGLSRSPTYNSWQAMIYRCRSANARSFEQYGAAGIVVCERWRKSFEAFLEDMGERPPGTSIDRIDSTGNYEPSNCRWATDIQQQRNKRSNLILRIDGRENTLSGWAEESGVRAATIRARLLLGWSIKEAVFTKPKNTRRWESKL